MEPIVLKGISECLTLDGVRKNRGVKPTEEDLGIVRNSAIVFDSKIIWIGKEENLPDEYSSCVHMDLKGKIVLPGLVDCHTHIVFGGERSSEYAQRAAGATYQEIAKNGGGIISTVKSTREASTDVLYKSALERAKESMSRGISTIEIKSGYGLSLDDELRILEVIKKLDETLPISVIPTFLGAHAIPQEFSSKRDSYINLICEKLIPQVAKLKLAKFCDIFIEKGYFTPEEGLEILNRAKQHGLKPKVHAEQLSAYGGSLVAAKVQAVSADHLEHVSKDDISALKTAGVIGVLLPGAAFFLGSKYPNARAIIDSGLPVAIATDWNPGTCMSGDLLFIATLAMSQMKMTAPEAITAITHNAAMALDLTDRGSIEPGKRADIAVFSAPSYKHLPYHFGSNHLASLYIEGKQVI